MKKQNNLHRGELLKNVISKSDLNITTITKRAGYNRSSYYNHILLADLSYVILEKYGKAMGYDFSKILPEMRSYISFEEPEGSYGEPFTIENVIKQRDTWKDKYLQLLEKYNVLIEERLGGK
ncbi:MAG: hypothetical protein EOP48_18570 [Sphingobacteriales bacterium]|nr:MAG: hypothetical protein EOP48_18570 [Sphingobacteriales bacterium]